MQDTNFIKDLERSTKARWEIVNKMDAEEKEQGEFFDIDKSYEYMKKYIKAESDILYKYENAEFKDAKLRKLAFDYIEGVKAQEKSLEYYYSDEDKFDELWEEGYDKRSVSLLKLNEEYGVKLDKKILKG